MALSSRSERREPRTQQERRAEAETKLIASATKLIARQGVQRTSLAQIGERAGFSRGIVNHHFGTKADLVKRLISDSQRTFAETVQGLEGTGLEAILGVADSYLSAIGRSSPATQAFLVMWAEAAGAASEFRASFIEGDRVFRTGLRNFVDRGIEDGSIRADISPDAFAAGLVAQLRGLGIEALVDPRGVNIDSLRADLLHSIAIALSPRKQRGHR
jgi:AcrR family transcriptional regulator